MLTKQLLLQGRVLCIAVTLLLAPSLDWALAQTLSEESYTFQEEEQASSPKAFISDSPGEISFESSARLEADISFEQDIWESWLDWHQDGAPGDEDAIQDYNLQPLSALTLGSSGYELTLEDGSRIINTGASDAVLALGSARIELQQDALVQGDWTGIALEGVADAELDSEIINQGHIGSFTDDSDQEQSSDFGIWVNHADAGDEFSLDNQGTVQGSISGLHVVGGSGSVSIENKQDAEISGDNVGISLGEVDPEAIWLMRDESIEYFKGDFQLDNEGQLTGDSLGLDVLGESAEITITNQATGLIQGSNNTGIRYLDSGQDGAAEIINYGEIQGGEVGIAVVDGSLDIENYGTLAGGEDAILYDQGATGGQIRLLASADGNIRHLGDSDDALLLLQDADDTQASDYQTGDLQLGQGRIRQQDTHADTTWSLGEVSAGSMRIESGATELSQKVQIEEDIQVLQGADLILSGAELSTRDLELEDGALLDFEQGRVSIDQGQLDYSNADLVLSGDQESSLELSDAQVLAQDVVVGQNSSLSGTGRLHSSLELQAGGTLQPGDPAGQLQIDDDLEVQQDSSLMITIHGAEQECSKLQVQGQADIQGGTLHLLDESAGTVPDGEEYTYIIAEQGLSGEFEEHQVQESALYDYTFHYSDNQASFTAHRLSDYSDYAKTANQRSVAQALESARRQGQLQGLIQAWEDLLEDAYAEQAPEADMHKALQQMSPEPYQAAFRLSSLQARQMASRTMFSARQSRLKMGTNSEQAQGPRLDSSLASARSAQPSMDQALQAVSGFSGRPRLLRDEMGYSAAGSYWRGFYSAFGQLGEIESGSGRTGYDSRTGGFSVGVERSLGETLTAGASLGYGNNKAEFLQGLGELRTHSARFGPHASYVGDRLELDLALSAAAHLNRQKREMTIPERRQATSRFKSYDGSAFTQARYNLTPGQPWFVVPSASMAYTYHFQEEHTEKAAGDARLEFEQDSQESLRSRLDLNISREISAPMLVLLPEVFAGWGYELLDEDFELQASLARAQDSSFQVEAQGPGKQSLHYGAGLTMLFGEYNVGFVRYEREERSDSEAEVFTAGVKWNF